MVFPQVGEDEKMPRKRIVWQRIANHARHGMERLLRSGGPSCEGTRGFKVMLSTAGKWARSSNIQPKSTSSGTRNFHPIGVGMAAIGRLSLRTGRADFPHPALQSVSHPLVAGLVRSTRAKAYREISPSFSKKALG